MNALLSPRIPPERIANLMAARLPMPDAREWIALLELATLRASRRVPLAVALDVRDWRGGPARARHWAELHEVGRYSGAEIARVWMVGESTVSHAVTRFHRLEARVARELRPGLARCGLRAVRSVMTVGA